MNRFSGIPLKEPPVGWFLSFHSCSSNSQAASSGVGRVLTELRARGFGADARGAQMAAEGGHVAVLRPGLGEGERGDGGDGDGDGAEE